jgi:hypothetical protein
MKKLLGLSLVLAATTSLSACGGIPTCYDELNECGRDTAYTEERTIKANRYKTVAPAPEPVVVSPPPAPAPVVVAPPPPPPVDTQVMRSAEPMVQTISK